MTAWEQGMQLRSICEAQALQAWDASRKASVFQGRGRTMLEARTQGAPGGLRWCPGYPAGGNHGHRVGGMRALVCEGRDGEKQCGRERVEEMEQISVGLLRDLNPRWASDRPGACGTATASRIPSGRAGGTGKMSPTRITTTGSPKNGGLRGFLPMRQRTFEEKSAGGTTPLCDLHLRYMVG